MIWAIRWSLASLAMQFSFWLMPKSRAKDDYVKAAYDVKDKIISVIEGKE